MHKMAVKQNPQNPAGTMVGLFTTPWKKRRGRPSSYLSVWLQNQERLRANQAAAEAAAAAGAGNNSTEQAVSQPAPGSAAGMTLSTTNGVNTPPQKLTMGISQYQSTPTTTNINHTSTTTHMTTSTPISDQVTPSPTPIHVDSNSSNCSPQRDLQSPLSCSGRSPSPTSVSMESVKSDSEREESDTSLPSASSPENNENLRLLPQAQITNNSQMLTPACRPNHQKPKRPVGRPPGTTKRPKPYEAIKAKSPQNSEFTLRKFFEKGGRDYQEFLEWAKQKCPGGQTAVSPMPCQQSVFPGPPITAVNGSIPTTGAPTHRQSPPVQQMQPSAIPNTHMQPAPMPQQQQQQQVMWRPIAPRPNSKPNQPTSQPPPPRPIHDEAMYRPMNHPQQSNGHQGLPYNHPQEQHKQQQHQHQQQQQHQPQQISLYRPPSQNLDCPHRSHSPETESAALDLSAKSRIEPQQGLAISTSTANTCKSLSPPLTASPAMRVTRAEVNNLHAVRPTIIEIEPRTCEDVSSLRRSPVEIHPMTATVPSQLRVDINGNHAVSLEMPPLLHAGRNGIILGDISTWDVHTVARFVASVPTCQEYARAFAEQDVDGAILSTLKVDHLVNFIKMKLGPAMRLMNALAEQVRIPSGNRTS